MGFRISFLLMFLVVVSSCATNRPDIRGPEDKKFYDTYKEWKKRVKSKPKSGYTWTIWDMQLDRKLGMQAQEHEAFLYEELKKIPQVIMILDQSDALRKKYSVILPTKEEGFVLEDRQQMWLQKLQSSQVP
jgi:hypothetical protein